MSNDTTSPDEPEERFAPLTWRAPDGSRVYGYDPDAKIPSEAPVDSGPVKALQAWRSIPRPLHENRSHPVHLEAWQVPPPTTNLPASPPVDASHGNSSSRRWPVHLGPARGTASEDTQSSHLPPADAGSETHDSLADRRWSPPPVEWRTDPPDPLRQPIAPHDLPQDVEVEPDPAPSAFEGEVNLAAIESARSLAWTAIALAIFLPPVGLGIGWFCLGIVRRSKQGSANRDAATSLARLSYLALLLGVGSLVVWIALLMVAFR